MGVPFLRYVRAQEKNQSGIVIVQVIDKSKGRYEVVNCWQPYRCFNNRIIIPSRQEMDIQLFGEQDVFEVHDRFKTLLGLQIQPNAPFLWISHHHANIPQPGLHPGLQQEGFLTEQNE